MIPFDPNGRAVDMLRRCYSTKIRPFFDSPAVAEIQWYRVKAETPPMPEGTIFTSLNYLDPWDWDDGPGEVNKERTWLPGVDPYNLPEVGNPAGPLIYFREGAPVMAAGSLDRDFRGCPSSCSKLPPVDPSPLASLYPDQEALIDSFTVPSPIYANACTAFLRAVAQGVAAAMPATMQVSLWWEYLGPPTPVNLTIADFELNQISFVPVFKTVPGPWSSGLNGLGTVAFVFPPSGVLYVDGEGGVIRQSGGWILFDSATGEVWELASWLSGFVPQVFVGFTPALNVTNYLPV